MTAGAASRTNSILRTLARGVAHLHTGIVALFALGWVLPWAAVHWIVIAGGLTMQVSWWLFRGKCPLTMLERALVTAASGTRAGGSEQEQLFVTRLLSGALRRPVPDAVGNLLTYMVLYASMAVCALRLVS